MSTLPPSNSSSETVRPPFQPHDSSATTTTTTSPPITKPPVDIHPTAHLDPNAYVRGTHGISLGAHVLVHPRAQLVSLHGPLIISDGCIISEKCIVGGPVPDPNSSLKDTSNNVDSTDLDATDPLKTFIAANVLLQPHATICAGATVGEACIIESHATVCQGVSVGAHSKICAGVYVARDVLAWSVVFGDGERRRLRVRLEGVESARLKGIETDRMTTGVMLKAASRAVLLKKK